MCGIPRSHGMVDAATRTCESGGRCWCAGNHGRTLAGRCYWLMNLWLVGLALGEGLHVRLCVGVQQPRMVSRMCNAMNYILTMDNEHIQTEVRR